MAKQYTKEELEAYYQKLPDVLKNAMYDADIADKIFEAGKKFGLNIDKIGELAEETGFVVLGLTNPKEFVKNLQERLDTPSEKTTEVAKEINHQIFFPLREELKKAHNMDLAAENFQKLEPLVRKPVAIPPPPPVTQARPTQPIAPKPSTPPPPITTPKSVPTPPPSLADSASVATSAKEAASYGGQRPPTTRANEPAKPIPPLSPWPLERKPEPIIQFPSKIVLDKKPELNLPPSKIPPIDLRQTPKSEMAPPQTGASPASKIAPSPNALPKPEPVSSGTGTGERDAPAEKKMPHGGTDPYRETV